MELISHHRGGSVVDPFTARTYELIDAWVADTGRGGVDGDTLVGDASAICLANDVLIQRGTPSWDACGEEVVHRVRAMGFGVVARTFGDAVLAFRRWLAANGHAGTEGIEALEACVRALVDEPGEVLTLSGRRAGASESAPPNRQERRAHASVERQRARRAKRRR